MPKPPLYFELGARFGTADTGPDVTYLLDDYLTNAHGFYGRHKLTSDAVYSGALERMRVDTGGQPEADYDVASDGLFVDTAAELAAAGANSAYMAKLYAQDGGGLHMGATIAANQYRSINAGVLDTKNSNPVLAMPGTGTYSMRSAGVGSFGASGTIMAVIAHDGGISNIVWGTSALGSYGYLSGALIYSKGTTATSAGVAHGVANGTLMLATWVLDNANCSIRVNGVEVDTQNVGLMGVSAYIDIGYLGAADFSIQNVGEFLAWDTNIGLAAIAAIEADVMSRWGIT